jgi:hypothetical protein
MTIAKTRRWRRAAFALFATAFGAATPVPLPLLYRHRLHLSEGTLTVAFAVYALGLLPMLFVSGLGLSS